MEEMDFNEYWNSNPRICIPDEFDKFILYAKERYKKVCGLNQEYFVNNSSCDNEEEMLNEVDSYFSDFGEAMILFRSGLWIGLDRAFSMVPRGSAIAGTYFILRISQ